MSDASVRRVLMTTDTVGGVWTFTLDLANGLANSGVEVVLAALGGAPSHEQASAAERIPGLCLLGSDFRLEWMDDPWRDVEASRRWLMRLYTDYSPDLVHLNSFGHGGLPWLSPVVLTAHSCVVSWWKAVRGGQMPASWRRYREEVARALDSADVVTVPSEAMARNLTESYGLAAQIRTIYNGVQINRFHPGEKEPFVLSAGRLWDEAKNVAALARIARELEWPVYLAGDCDGSELDGCRLLGKLTRDEMSAWCSRASIYTSPALYEPFGLAVVEAALSGCALVLGDIPALREIWGDAALFVTPSNTAELEQAINELIANPALRQEMSRRSRLRALNFNATQMTRQYLELYKSLVTTGKRQCVS